MKRVLVAASLATLLIMGTASADSTTVSCGAGMGVHNNATCSVADMLIADGVPSVDIAVEIADIPGIFYGDVQVTLANNASLEAEGVAFVQKFCAYRPTNLLAGTCTESTSGEFTPGEPLFCLGRGSGIGGWTVECTITTVEG